MHSESRRVTTAAAALILSMSPRTLERWRRTGDGPRYIQISRNAIRYDVDELARWLASRERVSTASA